MTEFDSIMSSGGDPDNWNLGSVSAVIYDLMSILDQCMNDGELEAFSGRVEALVLMSPPPLNLLSELEDVMLNRRRELRQREFDMRARLGDLLAKLSEASGLGAQEWLNSSFESDEQRVYEPLIASARRACDRAERDLLLLETAIAIVSDWLRGLSASAWWGRGEWSSPPGSISGSLPPFAQ